MAKKYSKYFCNFHGKRNTDSQIHVESQEGQNIKNNPGEKKKRTKLENFPTSDFTTKLQ